MQEILQINSQEELQYLCRPRGENTMEKGDPRFSCSNLLISESAVLELVLLAALIREEINVG